MEITKLDLRKAEIVKRNPYNLNSWRILLMHATIYAIIQNVLATLLELIIVPCSWGSSSRPSAACRTPLLKQKLNIIQLESQSLILMLGTHSRQPAALLG